MSIQAAILSPSLCDRGAVSSGLPSTLKTGKNGAGSDNRTSDSGLKNPCTILQDTLGDPLERHAIIFFVSMGCVLVNPLGFSNKQHANGHFDYVKKAAVFLSMLSD